MEQGVTTHVIDHHAVIRQNDVGRRIASSTLQHFLHDMGTLMRGHYDWARRQKRYAATDNYVFDAPRNGSKVS